LNFAMKGFQIVLIKPDGFDFVESFREVMEAMQWGLQQLGHEAPIHVNVITPDLTPIVFGAHHLAADAVGRLPASSIIYNLEQLMPGYPWFQAHYLDLLRRFSVWDADADSTAWLRNSGIALSARHVPVAFAPLLCRIVPAAEQDVDVLFYGIQTGRRLRILRALGDAGLRVVALTDVWARERDGWIARGRLTLGVHQREGGRLEAARLVYLLANGVPVVTEVDDPRSVEPAFHGAFVPAHYNEIVSCCRILAGNADLRAHLARAGRSAAQRFDARRIMAHALSPLNAP
jgi:hypothetical protein